MIHSASPHCRLELSTGGLVLAGTASHYSFAVEKPESLMVDTFYAQVRYRSPFYRTSLMPQKQKSKLSLGSLQPSVQSIVTFSTLLPGLISLLFFFWGIRLDL